MDNLVLLSETDSVRMSGMARHLRQHVCGGWYHITTRGMGRQAIFQDEHDRAHFLELLAGVVERYGVVLHAYVLMDNHYHLLLETPAGNTSRAVRMEPPPTGRRSKITCGRECRKVRARD